MMMMTTTMTVMIVIITILLLLLLLFAVYISNFLEWKIQMCYKKEILVNLEILPKAWNTIFQLYIPTVYSNYIFQLYIPTVYSNYIFQLYIPTLKILYYCGKVMFLPTSANNFKSIFGSRQGK